MRVFLDSSDQIISRLGFGRYGDIQNFVDHTLQESMNPFVPKWTGKLRETATRSDFGSGEITYTTDYAEKIYYFGRMPGTKPGHPLQSRLWDKYYIAARQAEFQKKLDDFMRSRV